MKMVWWWNVWANRNKFCVVHWEKKGFYIKPHLYHLWVRSDLSATWNQLCRYTFICNMGCFLVAIYKYLGWTLYILCWWITMGFFGFHTERIIFTKKKKQWRPESNKTFLVFQFDVWIIVMISLCIYIIIKHPTLSIWMYVWALSTIHSKFSLIFV